MIRGRGIFALILIFLCLPYVSLLGYLPNWQWPEADEFFWALKNSILQAGGSALLALFTALLLLPGYLRLTGKWRVFAAWGLLSPSFFPPLFLLLSFFAMLNPFPMGLAGIVLIQGFMNAGLLCVLLAQSFEEKWTGLVEMSRVFGASRLFFLRTNAKAILPDLISSGLFVFAMSFASFSIPLVVGAGKATTLEILIYEKIRISNEWGSALALSFMQLVLMSLFVLIPSAKNRLQESRARNLSFWGTKSAIPFVAIYILFFWGPLVIDFPSRWMSIRLVDDLFKTLLRQTGTTLLFPLFTGLLCLGLFLISCFGGARNGIPRLMRGWIAPSSALVGFAFLFMFGFSVAGSEISYVLAMAIIFFPAVYRLGLDRQVESLQPQIEVAKTLGASDFLIWKSILVPQIWKTSCLLAGVAAVWAIGEFALGKVILEQPKTWALTAESLLSSFRVEQGLAVNVLILIAGGLVFSFFWGLSYVRR